MKLSTLEQAWEAREIAMQMWPDRSEDLAAFTIENYVRSEEEAVFVHRNKYRIDGIALLSPRFDKGGCPMI